MVFRAQFPSPRKLVTDKSDYVILSHYDNFLGSVVFLVSNVQLWFGNKHWRTHDVGTGGVVHINHYLLESIACIGLAR